MIVAASGAAPASETADVDLELVLIVDASASISGNTMRFQLEGHAAAFRSKRIVDAIAGGEAGAIAVTLASFAGPDELTVLVPWMRIAGPEEAVAFADAIDGVERADRPGSTALGSAILEASELFEDNGFEAPELTIDLSSNGFSNSGIAPALARDAAVERGITVNALAILNEYPWLEGYYREQVIGGAGAFVETAEDQNSFAQALLAKLVQEIAVASAQP